MVLSFAISGTALVLELSTILLLLRRGLWRIYGLLFVYALWLFAANCSLLLTDVFFHSEYAIVYWHVDSADIALRLLVVWEIFRQTFPKNSGLNRTLSKGLGTIALGLLILAGVMFLGFQSFQNYGGLRPLHLALDRSFCFVEALMILGTLVMARYYGVTCGRNVLGIALGFGAWVSISTANSALVDLINSFRPYGDYLRPLSFVFMMVVWIWALWVYEPNPPIKESEGLELNQWVDDWNRTISTTHNLYGHD